MEYFILFKNIDWNIEMLGSICSIIAVIITSISYIYRLRKKNEDLKKEIKLLRNKLKFPYEIGTIENLINKIAITLPDIPYIDRGKSINNSKVQIKSERFLILGRKAMGKTREALNLIEELTKNESTYTLFLVQRKIGRPEIPLPQDIQTVCAVVFLDDITRLCNAWITGKNRQIMSDSKEFGEKLEETLKYFEDHFARVIIIATTRIEEFKLFEDNNMKLWDTFNRYFLEPITKKETDRLIFSLSEILEIKIEDEVEKLLASNNDGTFGFLVYMFLYCKTHKILNIGITEIDSFKIDVVNAWEKSFNQLTIFEQNIFKSLALFREIKNPVDDRQYGAIRRSP